MGCVGEKQKIYTTKTHYTVGKIQWHMEVKVHWFKGLYNRAKSMYNKLLEKLAYRKVYVLHM